MPVVTTDIQYSTVQEDLASAIKQEKERKYAYVRKKMVFISGLYYLGHKSAHFSFKRQRW